MQLNTKGLIFTVLLALSFSLNFVFGIKAIRELKATNEITSQEYKIARRVEKLRLALFDYYNSGLVAAFTETKSYHENFLKHRNELFEALRKDVTSPHETGLENQVSEIEKNAQRLMAKEANPNRIVSDLVHIRRTFLSPSYQKQLAEIEDGLEEIVKQADRLVTVDRELNDVFYDRAFPFLICIFTFSLLILLRRLWYLRREIIIPIQKIIEVVDKVRLGDLSHRFDQDCLNEVGLAGKTLNKMIEELQKRRQERLEFVSSVVHDLRNPLTALNLNCDFALKAKKEISREDAVKVIQRVKGQVDRLLRLTNDLYLSTQDIHPTWEMRISFFDLAILAREVIDVFRSSHPDYHYSLIHDEVSTVLHADRDRMAQVLTNLVSNATKYSPPGTTIEVHLSGNGHSVSFEIRDQGVGIPDETKTLIFEPFTRLESGQKMSVGSGLGLSIVKDFVHFHFGSITVKDRKEGGTVFSVTLPRNHPGQPLLASSIGLPNAQKNIDHLHSVR